MKRRNRSTTVLAALVVAGIALGGCGTSSPSTPASASTGATGTEKACMTLFRDFRIFGRDGHGYPSTIPALQGDLQEMSRDTISVDRRIGTTLLLTDDIPIVQNDLASTNLSLTHVHNLLADSRLAVNACEGAIGLPESQWSYPKAGS